MKNRNKILVIGSVALDSVETPFGQVSRALGGSATFFSAAARVFAPVSISAVVGKDFPIKYLRQMRRLNICLDDLKIVDGKTFHWKGYYGEDLNSAHTLKTELNVFKDFKPQLNEENRQTRYVFLANIDPEIQSYLLVQLENPSWVACDTMNFWIQHKKASLIGLLKKVTVFLCNEAEAKQLSEEKDLFRASRWLLGKGPKIVVVKKGEYGVACYTRRSQFMAPAYPVHKVMDPTGAGDSFAGGFLGYLARVGNLDDRAVRRGIVYGSILASYNVESFSLDRLARLTRPEIESRFKRFRQMTQFS